MIYAVNGGIIRRGLSANKIPLRKTINDYTKHNNCYINVFSLNRWHLSASGVNALMQNSAKHDNSRTTMHGVHRMMNGVVH